MSKSKQRIRNTDATLQTNIFHVQYSFGYPCLSKNLSNLGDTIDILLNTPKEENDTSGKDYTYVLFS